MLLALAVRFRLLHRPLEPALTDPREHRRGGHRHGRERGPCRLSLRGRGPLPVAGAAQDTSAAQDTDPLIAPLSLLPPSKWVKDQQHKVWSNRVKFSDLVYEVGEQSPAGTSAGAAQDSSAKTRGGDPRHRERARPRHDHR